MNAAEAKEISDKVRKKNLNSDYEKLMKAVETAVKKGERSCDIQYYVRADLEKKLKEEGYSVENGDYPRDPDGGDSIKSYTRITWSQEKD